MNDSRPPANEEPSLEKASRRKPLESLRNIAIYLFTTQKWWLIPVIAALLIVGALVLLTSTPLGAFLYPLF